MGAAFRVEIKGELVVIEDGSLSIEDRIEERSVANFVVIDMAGAQQYEQGEPVYIYDAEDVYDDDPLFGGVVDSSEVTRLVPGGGRYHSIYCADWHYLADKRIAAKTYQGEGITCGYVVGDLLTEYLADEGILEGEIQAGPTVAEVIVNYVRVSDAMDTLAEKSGFIWYIDASKHLYFIDRATNNAWAIADTLDVVDGTAKLSIGNPMYRNRQYVRGAMALTDPHVETFTGDGVTMSFAVGYPIAKVPTITVDGVGQSKGIKGLDINKQFYWSKGDAVVVAAEPPGNGLPVVVSYQGQFRVVIISQDPAHILWQQEIEGGGTGYVEEVEDEPETTDLEAAFESAASLLLKYCQYGKQFIYQTYRPGLKAGQLQLITYPSLGIDASQMLIESITVSARQGKIVYDVTAIEGPELGSWAQLFRKLAQRRVTLELISMGVEEVVIILEQVAEDWGWQETLTPEEDWVISCPIPSSTLYPSAALYPC